MITKNIFLKTACCPTLGWLTNSGNIQKQLSIADKFSIEQGLEIQHKARNNFLDGHIITGDNISAAKNTQELLKDKTIHVIFEATFIIDNCIAKADMLKRKESGWHVIEVKSSLNDKNEFIDDIAYTVMVASKAGLEISDCSLMLLSRDYRLGMTNDKLFTEIDHTDEALQRAKEFTDYFGTVTQSISQGSKPDAELELKCRGCDIFKKCVGRNIQNHIFDLPRLSQKKFCQLIDLNVVKIEDIPNDFPLTPNQTKVNDSVKAGQPIIDQEGMSNALKSISFPTYNLDFETVQTAIPLYSNIAPYTQIPTQYSLHVCSSLGQVKDHFKYLADPMKDCRKELAEKLLSDCGTKGSIIVYTSFEKTRIMGLAEILPDLASGLESLVTRLVDLNAIISKHLYHPEFHGSSSIKKVLPVLVPNLSYTDMDVSNGRDASAIFAYIAKGKYDEEEVKEKRKQLLKYCELDTLAMVKLHERLKQYSTDA